MGRIRKNTVDHFLHDCKLGATMFILEQRWGNDGYTFWFKLLELLGDSENHFIDAGKPEVWEFLTAKCRVSGETATDILGMLAKLGAIDADLWNDKIVWSQKFVDRLAEVYRKRATVIPAKPSIRAGNAMGSDESADIRDSYTTTKSTKSTKSIKKDLPPQKDAAASPPRKLSGSTSLTHRLIGRFGDAYEQATGQVYAMTPGRDGKIMRDIAQALANGGGMEDDEIEQHVVAAISRFFDPGHQFKGNMDIPQFKRAFNRLQVGEEQHGKQKSVVKEWCDERGIDLGGVRQGDGDLRSMLPALSSGEK